MELKFIVSLTLVRDDVVVVCGVERRMEWIKAYVLHTGEELESFTAPGACAVAAVKLGGKLALAIAYRSVAANVDSEFDIL